MAAVSHRKRHFQRSDIVMIPEFVTQVQATIDEARKKYIRAFRREMGGIEDTIRHVVHEDLRYKYYVIRREQVLSERTRDNRLTRAKMSPEQAEISRGIGNAAFFLFFFFFRLKKLQD